MQEKSKPTPAQILAIAGAVAIGLGIVVWFFLRPSAPTPPDGPIATAPIELLFPIDPYRQDPFTLGMLAYKEKQYKEAIELLQQLDIEQDPPYAKLYLGVSQLLYGVEKQAIQTLEPIEQAENPHLIHLTRWYLAMAYLEADNPQQAIPLLKKLERHISYSGKAQKILETLEN